MAFRCALVGLGRIGSLLEDDPLREKPCTHAGAMAGNPDCEIVGGCDLDPERRERFRERWEVTAVFPTIAELLRETAPELLAVATHPDSHFAMVRAAARSGVRVVVCEKPLADSRRDAERIARLHRSGRITVLVNHERRYSADYLRAKDRIERGDYGSLLSVTAKLFFGRTRSPRRMLWHDGTHLADIISFLCGSSLRVLRRSGPLDREGAGVVLVCRAGAIPVVIEAAAGRDYLQFELDLSFGSGRIRIGNGLYEEQRSGESPYYEGYRSLLPDHAVPPPEKTGYFARMMEDAVACLREPGRRPVSSAEDGLAVIRFLSSL